MRVLYSCLSRSWGGMEMFAIFAVEKLLERGIHSELLCYPGSKIYETAKAKGLIVHGIKAGGYFHPLEAAKVAGILRSGKFDLVHTQASKDLWVLVPAVKMVSKHIPLFMTKQVGSFIVKKDFLHKWIYNRLDYALAISEVISRNLLDTCPLIPDKVKLLHNAVDTKKFDPGKADREKIRKEFNLAPDKIVIGMLARFSWGKGHEEFVTAAAALLKKHDNLKFMIVGEPSRGEDDYGQKIQAMVEKLGNSGDTFFTGFRSDIPDILSAMDIFAFPSHSEAFGIALAEAMSMGKPTVVSNSDGVLDIVLDGETSLLFEVKSAADLEAKLETLINSPEMMEKFSVAARERIVNNFDIELLTDKVIRYYQDALNK